MKRANKLSGRCMIFAVGAMIAVLTGCSSGKPYGPAYGQTSQPPYLYLPAGQPYVPVQAEKWVSPQLLQQKDETILELTRALERAGVQPYLPGR